MCGDDRDGMEDHMADGIAANVHRATSWSIGISILMVAAGFAAILVPTIAGLAVTATVGWLLIFSGALQLAFAWRAGHASGMVWQILIGAAYGAIGLYLIARPLVGLASLTFAVALYLLVEGTLEFILSFQLRPAGGTGWLLADGIITLLLAAMIWVTWPSSAVWIVGTLVGIKMLFSGITRLMMSLAIRRIVA